MLGHVVSHRDSGDFDGGSPVKPQVREAADASNPAPAAGAEDRDATLESTGTPVAHHRLQATEAAENSSERGSSLNATCPMSAPSATSASYRQPGTPEDRVESSPADLHAHDEYLNWWKVDRPSDGTGVAGGQAVRRASTSSGPFCHRKRAPRRHQPYVEHIDVPAAESGQPLVSAYKRCCQEIGTLPNPVLIEAFEAADSGTGGTGHLDPLKQHIHVHCPGNLKAVFCRRLDDPGMVPAAITMARCGPRLRSLSLPYNRLSNNSSVSLSAVLHKCTALRSLNLRANDIEGLGAKKLCEGLRNCSWIEDLDLSLNPIGDEGALALAEWLRSNRSLRRLNVGSCHIALDGLIAITTTLKEANRTLESLNIADVEKVLVQPDHCFHLGSMVEINNTLTELCLSKQRLRDQGVKVMVPSLKRNTSLKKIDLSCNQITFLGAKAICDLLRANTPLQVLNLDCNRLAEHGARYIAVGVHANHKLEVLHLNNNSIAPQGLVDLAGALMINDCLRQVTLAMNQFDSKTAAIFGRLIGPNSPRGQPLKTDFTTYEVEGITFVSSLPLPST
uniref:Leucine rich repeat-containing protein n=1 Tax=Neospora caninum (strain Liverpool) TaxID=572307 RepID=A0A0F7UA48_NEOCL|nr:TPA: leucine rich repeat-containing protein [Neospora caninum Liverpool]